MRFHYRAQDSEFKLYWTICFAALALLLWSLWSVPIHGLALIWACGIGIIYGTLGALSRAIRKPLYHMIGVGIAVTFGQIPALALISRSQGEDWEYGLQYVAIVLLLGSGFVLVQRKSLQTSNEAD